MSTEENKEIVRRWNSADEFWTIELLADDYANRSGTEAPWAVIFQGLAEAEAAFGQMLRDDPTFRVTIDDMIAEDDTVAVRMIFYEKGKPSANAMAFYRLRDGKIVDDWACWSNLENA
jgi:ketosteroid isomerase-like protein